MGTSLVVVSDNNADLATWTAKQLESYILDHRDLFIGPKNDIPATIEMVAGKEKPVLLLDMGDNIGGGSQATTFACSKDWKKTGPTNTLFASTIPRP